MGTQGVKAKYVRIELRKIETLPGGGTQSTFFDYVGQSPINLWQSSEEFSTLQSVSAPVLLLQSLESVLGLVWAGGRLARKIKLSRRSVVHNAWEGLSMSSPSPPPSVGERVPSIARSCCPSDSVSHGDPPDPIEADDAAWVTRTSAHPIQIDVDTTLYLQATYTPSVLV